MRMSSLFLRTLRDDPADAEVDSHKLLVRAGCIRRVASGIYSWLPLGNRVMRNVAQIVREEMDAAGAQEVSLPIAQPLDLWKRSGRDDAYGPMMFRVQDRKEAWYAMSPTAEEVVTTLVAGEYSSYRDLPVNLYQINWKYRDELRPRFGPLRAREFLMKDAYSFDADLAGLQRSYDAMYDAYTRVFTRCGLTFRSVEGAIRRDRWRHEPGVHGRRRDRRGRVRLVRALRIRGQHRSRDPTADSGAGEPGPGPARVGPHAGHARHRRGRRSPGHDRRSPHEVHRLRRRRRAGPRARSRRSRGQRVRGHRRVRAAPTVRLYTDADFAAHPEIPKGYIGPDFAGAARVIADSSIRAPHGWVTGANRVDHHDRNVVLDRDFTPTDWAEIAIVEPGDPCPSCGSALRIDRGIEVGHVFQLGDKYSKALGATYTDDAGDEHPMVMGCYGIGVSRILSAIVEEHHDEHGIAWPAAVAPYQVHIVALPGRGDAAAAVTAGGRRRSTTVCARVASTSCSTTATSAPA